MHCCPIPRYLLLGREYYNVPKIRKEKVVLPSSLVRVPETPSDGRKGVSHGCSGEITLVLALVRMSCIRPTLSSLASGRSLKLQRAFRRTRTGGMGGGYSTEFEVHGRVQGVFFRACTQEKAKSLGLVGWVMNTPRATVKGVLQGNDEEAMRTMKTWLSTQGSPASIIERCEFLNEKEVEKLEYNDFEVRRKY
jgi:acylphosphatase